jgi:hypothetical protein
METLSSTLCFMGALLFMLGLLTGFGIPKFRSPRIGLSAHLAAIESGLGLIAFGLRFRFWRSRPHGSAPSAIRRGSRSTCCGSGCYSQRCMAPARRYRSPAQDWRRKCGRKTPLAS